MSFPQDKNTSFIDELNEDANALINSVRQQPKVVILDPNQEESYDIWLFKYNHKLERWVFVGVYLNGIFDKLEQQGFYKRYNPDGKTTFFLLDEDNLISEVLPVRMRDCIWDYSAQNQDTISTKKYSLTYAKRREKLGWTNNSIFNDKTQQGLSTHEKPFLRDDTNTSYLPFLNGIVRVTKDRIELIPYSEMEDVCLWKSQVIQRQFNLEASLDCHFAQFVKNVSNHEHDRELALQTNMGYSMHSFNRPSEGQAVIFCDEELTDKTKPQGGTGKGIAVTACQQMRPVAYIDGKKFDPDNQFCFQSVDRDSRIVWLDDVKHNFSFERFFSIVSVGWTIEKKNQHAFTLSRAEGPKLIICTNVAPNNEGSSNVRRQSIVEFSDFYKKLIRPGEKSQPIRDVHGCEFFTDEWNKAEWERFDRYMVECVFLYMNHGLVPHKARNVHANRLIQTTSDEFYSWVTNYEGEGLKANYEYSRVTLLAEFRTFTQLSEKEMPSRRFSEFVKRYASSKGWTYKLGNSNKNPSFTLESKQ